MPNQIVQGIGIFAFDFTKKHCPESSSGFHDLFLNNLESWLITNGYETVRENPVIYEHRGRKSDAIVSIKGLIDLYAKNEDHKVAVEFDNGQRLKYKSIEKLTNSDAEILIGIILGGADNETFNNNYQRYIEIAGANSSVKKDIWLILMAERKIELLGVQEGDKTTIDYGALGSVHVDADIMVKVYSGDTTCWKCHQVTNVFWTEGLEIGVAGKNLLDMGFRNIQEYHNWGRGVKYTNVCSKCGAIQGNSHLKKNIESGSVNNVKHILDANMKITCANCSSVLTSLIFPDIRLCPKCLRKKITDNTRELRTNTARLMVENLMDVMSELTFYRTHITEGTMSPEGALDDLQEALTEYVKYYRDQISDRKVKAGSRGRPWSSEPSIKTTSPPTIPIGEKLHPFVRKQSEDGGVGQEAIREKYPNAYTPWTNEADAELITMYQGGATVKELAIYFKREYGGIRSRLLKLGLIKRKKDVERINSRGSNRGHLPRPRIP